MNQIAEDISQDEEIAAPLTVVESPKSEFIRPPYSFKGAELFPFTYGYEILFNQVRDPEDTGLFTWMAFIHLLRKRADEETPEEHRKWSIPLAWKVESFRESLIAWMDENGPFTAEDRTEAKRIFEESMKAVQESRVEAVPMRGRSSQKKNLPPEEAVIIYLLRNKLRCSRDEILWEMPITELNQMLHSFYFMEGREVRKPREKSNLFAKFQRAISLFGKR